MNEVEAIIRERKEHGVGVLSCYLMLGYPSLRKSIDLMVRVAQAGADIIEIGIPFSDPIADGPIIQHAATVALNNGTKVKNVWDAVNHLKEHTDAGILIMGYFNSFLRYPLNTIIQECKDAGVSGFIIPDLPPEHVEFSLPPTLGIVHLVAPNTSQNRLQVIATASRPFVYLTSNYGITGSNMDVHERTSRMVTMIREINPHQALLIGFGIDSPKKAEEAMKTGVDGIIVGSALIKTVNDGGEINNCERLVKSIRARLNSI